MIVLSIRKVLNNQKQKQLGMSQNDRLFIQKFSATSNFSGNIFTNKLNVFAAWKGQEV